MNPFRLSWKVIGVYLISLLIPFSLENAAEIWGALSGKCESDSQGLMGRLMWAYQRALEKLAPSEITASHVRIVSLNRTPEGDRITGNVCEARKFLSLLIPAIRSAGPDAIVIDWSNSPTSCADKLANDAYEAAVAKCLTGSPSVPVVVGRSTLNQEELKEEDPEAWKRLPRGALGGGRFIALSDLFDGKKYDGKEVQSGLMRLNCDVRKIPLSWPVYPRLEAAVSGAGTDSQEALSLVAIRASNHAEALETSTLSRLYRNNSHPFATLISEDKLVPVHAIDLLCGYPPEEGKSYETCTPGDAVKEKLQKLHGKIVLISDFSNTKDQYETPVGSLHGVYLHASYIESLLHGEGYYLKPVHLIWQILVSLAWFAVVESIFHRCREEPLLALALSLAATLVFGLLFWYIVERLLGFFFVLLPPSLILIAIRAWNLLTEKQESGRAPH